MIFVGFFRWPAGLFGLLTLIMPARLLAQAIDPAKGGVDEFSALLAKEIPKWEKVIAGAKIPPQ